MAVIHVIRGARWLLQLNSRWMSVDLALALVPLLLAMALFRTRHRHGPLWWLGVAGFVVFLPNAPYVVTDLIHLIPAVHAAPSRRAVALGLLPLYATFIGTGVESYVLCVRLVRRELRRSVGRWPAAACEVTIHAASIVGVLLGRVFRLNSWDVVHPRHVAIAATSLLARPLLLAATGVAVLFAAAVFDRATEQAFRLAARLQRAHAE